MKYNEASSTIYKEDDMKGFVNITLDHTSTSKPSTIVNRISNVDNVKFVHLVTGFVDAIAFVDAPTQDDFRDAIFAISKVSGVASTNTNVAL